MDLQAIARAFDRDGCAVVPGVLGTDDVGTILSRVQLYAREIAPGLEPGRAFYEDGARTVVKAFHAMDKYEPFFEALRRDPRLLGIVGALWADGEVVPGPVSYFGKAARSGSVTPPHQDNAFQHWEPPLALELTIALDASDESNGVLTCQRGSHALGYLPHRASGVMGFSQTLERPLDPVKFPPVALSMRPGDICLHHINIVHYSAANPSDRSRRQLGLAYHNSLAQQNPERLASYMAERDRVLRAAAGQA